MSSLKDQILFGLIFGLIGVPLSYLAMRIEKKDVDLKCISWVRIYITFVITSIIAQNIYEKVI